MIIKFLIFAILLEKSFAYTKLNSYANISVGRNFYQIQAQDALRIFQTIIQLNKKYQNGNLINHQLQNFIKITRQHLDSINEKERQNKLKQERKDDIFRKYLASRTQSSFMRDFLTMRY